MIKSIQIINVRGIENRTFSFNDPEMHPNKVHLLIASNGFGKSSISTAFESLNNKRLVLKDRDYFRHEISRRPKLEIVVKSGSTDVSLTADPDKNEIAKEFNVFVIRGPRKVRAYQRPADSGYQVPIGEFFIEPIELCKIPEQVYINYGYREAARKLGNASKAAPNISDQIKDRSVIEAFLESEFNNSKLGSKLAKKYEGLLGKIETLAGRKDEVLAKIEHELWADIQAIPELHKLIEVFSNLCSRGEALLAALQLIEAARSDLKAVKKAKSWATYCEKKAKAKELLEKCNPNSDWIKLEVKESKEELVISLPKPENMSNGQRDFLCFLSHLLDFEFRSEKMKSILIIDEVFDYLDYANLVVCQYYLKKFIDVYSESGRQLFPIVLTHLDPSVFNSFIFSKRIQKNHYLDKVEHIKPDGGIFKMIRLRGPDSDFEKVFATYHGHHSLTDCDEKEMFEKKGLKKSWGCSKTFKEYCRTQVDNYLGVGATEIDYLAVCLGLRSHIEKFACDQLSSAIRQNFVDTRKTVAKLDFAVENGATVSELHYLLAGLYNSALHTNKPEEDILTPVVTKLQNACIREMVREAFNTEM